MGPACFRDRSEVGQLLIAEYADYAHRPAVITLVLARHRVPVEAGWRALAERRWETESIVSFVGPRAYNAVSQGRWSLE